MYLVRIFRDSSHLLASDHGRSPIMERASGMLQKIKTFGRVTAQGRAVRLPARERPRAAERRGLPVTILHAAL